MIELTEQQCQAVKKGQAIRVLAPEIGSDVVLLSAQLYHEICARLEEKEDQQLQEGWQKLALQGVALAMEEEP